MNKTKVNKILAILLVFVALALVRNPFPDVNGNFNTVISWGEDNGYGHPASSGHAKMIVDAYLLEHNLTDDEFPVYIPFNDEGIPKPSKHDWFSACKFLVAVGCSYGIFLQKDEGLE